MKIKKLLNSWLFIIIYLIFLLVLPISILLTRSGFYYSYHFIERATEPVALSAYYVTFSMAIIACLINSFFGLILAWVLTRYTFPGKKILDIIIDLPFALPTSVAGFTLITIYNEKSFLGSLLAKINIQIAFTRYAIVVAMIFVSFPFIVRSIQPSLKALEKELEQASWLLGASDWQTFKNVIFPTLLPSFLTGLTLSFSRAIGEYGSIIIVSSNFPLKDLVASVLIFQCLEQYDYIGATVIGTVMLLISLFLITIINIFQTWSNKL